MWTKVGSTYVCVQMSEKWQGPQKMETFTKEEYENISHILNSRHHFSNEALAMT